MATSNLPLNLQNLNLNEFWTIYPLYLNSNRTQQQGRKISKEKAVADPNVQEIEQVLGKINGARIIVELDKRHPREINVEHQQFLGRVRISLPANQTEIKNRNQLLLYVADGISKMERKKFKVHQLVQEKPDTTSEKASASNQNPKKSGGRTKKNSRKK